MTDKAQGAAIKTWQERAAEHKTKWNRFPPPAEDFMRLEIVDLRAALKAQPAPTEAQGDHVTDVGEKVAAQDEDSARLDALASEIEAMAPAHDRGCFGKRSDFDHYAEGHEYARKAAAARIREFAVVPQPQEQS